MPRPTGLIEKICPLRVYAPIPPHSRDYLPYREDYPLEATHFPPALQVIRMRMITRPLSPPPRVSRLQFVGVTWTIIECVGLLTLHIMSLSGYYVDSLVANARTGWINIKYKYNI